MGYGTVNESRVVRECILSVKIEDWYFYVSNQRATLKVSKWIFK
jgi:hypothetical protein